MAGSVDGPASAEQGCARPVTHCGAVPPALAHREAAPRTSDHQLGISAPGRA